MSTITTLLDWITWLLFRTQINTNFSNLNTDKAELSGATFTGDISVPDEAYWAGWNGSLEVPTKNAVYDKIETMWGGGATTFIWLTDTPSSYAGQALKVPQVNAGETALEFVTLAGGGDALTTNPLSQFASTTSLQLAGVISDETGSGALVFATSPTLVTPVLGVATATSINGATITSGTLNGSVTGTNTGDQTSIVWITGTVAQFNTAITDGDMATLAGSETLTNKTLTSPVVNVGSDATWDIYYRNVSWILTRLPIGTAWQVLNVSSGIPAWTTSTWWAEWTLLETLSPSSASTSNSSTLSAYDMFKIVFNIAMSTNGVDFRLQVNSQTWTIYARKTTTGTAITNSSTQTFIQLFNSEVGSPYVYWELTLAWKWTDKSGIANVWVINTAWLLATKILYSSDITSFQFYQGSAATFTGSIKIYWKNY